MHKTLLTYFNDCTFVEDTHTYFVGSKKLDKSVSDIIHLWEPKTDFDSIALRLDEKFNLPSGSHSRMWEYKANYACAIGTSTHYFAELYAINRNLKPNNGFEVAAKAFVDNLPQHIKIVATEYVMYHKRYKFGGMSDLILYNELTQQYIIADYKTNENLHKCFNDEKLLAPFSNLPNSLFGKYCLQLSTYREMAEQTGYSFGTGVIVWLKPTGEYELLLCEEQSMDKILSTTIL